jgi:hypothetical protein
MTIALWCLAWPVVVTCFYAINALIEWAQERRDKKRSSIATMAGTIDRVAMIGGELVIINTKTGATGTVLGKQIDAYRHFRELDN